MAERKKPAVSVVLTQISTLNQVFFWLWPVSVLTCHRHYMCMLCGLTFSVMSSEHEANKLPVGSHLMAFTSFFSMIQKKKHIRCLWMHLNSINNCLRSSGEWQCFMNWSVFRWFPFLSLTKNTHNGKLPYRVSLEGLDRSVLTQLTHMDAHVCAAGSKCVVALPVHVQSWCCWEAETERLLLLQQWGV